MTGIKQSISDQTGNFGFQFNLSISDLTKNVNAGFTGDTSVNWNFYQGKIYDNKKYYCGSYQSNQQVSISGNIGANTYDYYINNQVTALGQAKSTGKINYLYLNSDSGNNIGFTSNVAGNLPNYSINTNINYYTGSTGIGYIINQSNGAFRIFSGTNDNSIISYLGNTTGNINPSGSGAFYNSISGAVVGNTYSGNYTFYTNFGTIYIPIIFTALASGLPSVYTQFNLNYSNFNGISGAPFSTYYDIGGVGFQSISGNSYIPTPFLDIQLSYVSGTTGNIYGTIGATGSGSLIASGNLTGSGYLSGFAVLTGTGYGYNSGINTGLISGYISELVYYTGIVSGVYAITGSGFVTGNVTNSNIQGTGTGNLYGSGLLTGSGYLNLFNTIFASGISGATGSIFVSNSGFAYATGINNFTIPITGYGSGTGYQNSYLVSSGTIGGAVSGFIVGTGLLSGILTGVISGSPSGALAANYLLSTGSGTGYFKSYFTGFTSGFFAGIGQCQITGVYNSGTGPITGNYLQTCYITGITSGTITSTGGFINILNPTGLPGSGAGYTIVTGSTIYITATGYILYNNPQPGDTYRLPGGTTIGYSGTFSSFSGLISILNNNGYFHYNNGTGLVPGLVAIDIGDHNTIQVIAATGSGSSNNPYLTTPSSYDYFQSSVGNSGTLSFSGMPFVGGYYYMTGGQSITPTMGTFQKTYPSGPTVYYPSTGYVIYNMPFNGDRYLFPNDGLLYYPSTFSSFSGLITTINNSGYFLYNNGTGQVPGLFAQDIGDHNTIEITPTTGSGSANNYYLTNTTYDYFYVYPSNSGTLAFSGYVNAGYTYFTGGSIYNPPSGTFNFYPSGNGPFYVIGSVNLTGSGNFTGYATTGITTTGSGNYSGFWPASGILNIPYTIGITTGNSGIINLNVATLQPISVIESGIGSGYLSNYIVGSGYLTGIITGLITGMTSGLINNYSVSGNGSIFLNSGQTATGYFSNTFSGIGNGAVTGTYNTNNSGIVTGNFNQTGIMTGIISGQITNGNGILTFSNSPGQTTTSVYPITVATGATIYPTPTGYIYYNTPNRGDIITLTSNLTFSTLTYLATGSTGFNSFSGLINNINSTGYAYFNNGTTNVPAYSGVDIGDHNTIQIVLTPPYSGTFRNAFLYGYYLGNNSGVPGNLGLQVIPISGTTTLSTSLFSGGGVYTPSGTFNFYPSGNFYSNSNLTLTGSGNYTGFASTIIYNPISILSSGLSQYSGLSNLIYVSGTPAFVSGQTGSALSPTGFFTGFQHYTGLATGYDYVSTSGTYTGFLSLNQPSYFLSSGILTGYVSGLTTSGLLYINQLITGSPFGLQSGFTGILPFSGYINNPFTGSGYMSSNISGLITGTINNVIIYIKSFTGQWDLNTGINQNSLLDFKGLGYFNSGKFYNPSGVLTNLTGNADYIAVSYIPYTGYTVDVANLLITGLNSGINILITGQRI